MTRMQSVSRNNIACRNYSNMSLPQQQQCSIAVRYSSLLEALFLNMAWKTSVSVTKGHDDRLQGIDDGTHRLELED